MNDNKATFTSRPVSSLSDSQTSTQVPRALAPRPLAVALRRVLGGGLLAAGLISPALGQSPDPVPNQSSSLDLSTLDSSNGFVLNGIAAGDFFGTSVSGAGDVNGDGIDDIIIGAPGATPNGGKTGQSYVVFGTEREFPAVLELSTLDGSNGFVLKGSAVGDYSGGSVSGAGDVNGDGIDDLLIGGFSTSSNGLNTGRLYSGQGYVVFGTERGFPAALELSALDGSNGFALSGIASDDFPDVSVSGAGDVNGDGIDDIIISTINGNPNAGFRSGQSYVVFGTGGGFPAALELSALDGSNGFVLNGIRVADYSGTLVSGAGDVNGDGFDDIIIGASGGSSNGLRSGQSYVVFGTSGRFPAALELSALDGSNGFALNGSAAYDDSGYSVSGAGDVNGDGFDDLLIGTGRTNQSYVVFGTGGGFPTALELSALDGSNGFVLNGIASDDGLGRSVSGAGDVNGDGFDDILIGAPGADPDGVSGASQSYVVFGAASFAPVFEISDLDGSNGMIFKGAGSSVSGAGDVNGDGLADLVIGGESRIYVVFGMASAGGGPAVLLKALITDVKALDLPAGLEHRLVTKLERTQKKLDQGYVAEAFHKVVRFTQQVRAQRGWHIPEAEADALIAQAKTLLNDILKIWLSSFRPAVDNAHDSSTPR